MVCVCVLLFQMKATSCYAKFMPTDVFINFKCFKCTSHVLSLEVLPCCSTPLSVSQRHDALFSCAKEALDVLLDVKFQLSATGKPLDQGDNQRNLRTVEEEPAEA